MTLDLRPWLYGVISALGAIPQASQPAFSRALQTALVLGLFAPLVVAQASPTAERQLNVQVGGMVSLARPGVSRDASVFYGRWNYSGGSIYATLDPHRRFGLEVGARQLFGEFVNQRTYSAGLRCYKPFGSYVPYAKVLLGRGTLKFPDSIGSSSFTTASFGGGVDYRVSTAIHFRGDYEYQRWLGFNNKVHGFPGSLTPQILSIGVAYHIH